MRFIFLFMELFFRQTHTHTHTMRTNEGACIREKKKQQSINLLSVSICTTILRKFTLNPEFDTILAVRRKMVEKNENEKLLPNQWFSFHQLKQLVHSRSLSFNTPPVRRFINSVDVAVFLSGLVPTYNYIYFILFRSKFKIEKECILRGSALAHFE